MRILLCNDDGIDAPGLAFLERAALLLSVEVFVVAPEAKRTAGSTALTVGRPLSVTRRDARRYAHSGTPADSVLVGLGWLLTGAERPDLVLSGVNDGRNVAEDALYSGTLGIAREAACWGLPALALSRVKEAQPAPGDAPWLADLLRALWRDRAEWFPEGHFLSLNLPARLPAPLAAPRIGRDKIAGRVEEVARQGETVTLTVPRGRPHSSRPGDENDALAQGRATLTRFRWHSQEPVPAEALARLAPGG